jgi:prepilin-type N-terminal cleavage/methylation domain-containing protein/prepilin-type processing-associated H-X9-DG protein
MNKARAFTLIELLVVISVIVIFMAILFPVLGRAREAGKHTVCLSNLRTLQLAWIIYAENNDEKIVRGYVWYTEPGTNSTIFTPSWTGSDTDGTKPISKDIQIQGIKAGTLYPYIGSVKPYYCPNGFRGFIRTYSIVSSMNGQSGDQSDWTYMSKENESWHLWLRTIHSRLQITNPPPASRMVFIDLGWPCGSTFSVSYDDESWSGSHPPCRHINGNTFSFADGHAEFWKWEGQETIASGRSIKPGDIKNTISIDKPTTNEGLKDLHKTQIAVWGELGYTPTQTE